MASFFGYGVYCDLGISFGQMFCWFTDSIFGFYVRSLMSVIVVISVSGHWCLRSLLNFCVRSHCGIVITYVSGHWCRYCHLYVRSLVSQIIGVIVQFLCQVTGVIVVMSVSGYWCHCRFCVRSFSVIIISVSDH